MADGQELELPRLPPVEHAEGLLVDGDVVQVDRAGEAVVLLDPRLLDGGEGDVEHALREHAEGQPLLPLGLDHLEHLLLGEDALLDKDLSDPDGVVIGHGSGIGRIAGWREAGGEGVQLRPSRRRWRRTRPAVAALCSTAG